MVHPTCNIRLGPPLDETSDDVTPPSVLMSIHLLQCLLMVSSAQSFLVFCFCHSTRTKLVVNWCVCMLTRHVLKLLSACILAAMNELRPCAPLSLKLILAQEVFQGLQAILRLSS